MYIRNVGIYNKVTKSKFNSGHINEDAASEAIILQLSFAFKEYYFVIDDVKIKCRRKTYLICLSYVGGMAVVAVIVLLSSLMWWWWWWCGSESSC